jgi:hypothetical protein
LEEGQQTVQPFLTILKGSIWGNSSNNNKKKNSEFLKFEICETEINDIEQKQIEVLWSY